LFIHVHKFTFRPLCLHSITKILRNGPRAHFPFKGRGETTARFRFLEADRRDVSIGLQLRCVVGTAGVGFLGSDRCADSRRSRRRGSGGLSEGRARRMQGRRGRAPGAVSGVGLASWRATLGVLGVAGQ
jgi:hypothetical protein